MAMQARKITLAHELDAAWIIALWKAIHGGDPSPIEADARSVELVGELTNHLGHTIGRGAQPLTRASFEARVGELGIQLQRQEPGGSSPRSVTPNAAAPGDPQGPPRQPPPYCFVFRGTSYCVHFPHPVFTLE
ncbi:MAG: hypothetical protein ACR2JY_16660 [Chloroflexota bacterium]